VDLDRLRTSRLDAALAAGFTAAGLVQTWIAPIARPGLGELFVLGTTLPLAWRRSWPVEAAAVAATFWLIPLDGFPLLGLLVVVLQFFAVGAQAGSPRVAAMVTAWASVTSVVGTLLGPEPPVAAIGGVLAVVAPVLAGALVRHQRRQTRALAALTAQLQDEQERAEVAAIGAERARIAQELHDVVGHELTLIAIQAEAASAALRRSPERAAEPVEAIRTTAHRTLAEIRGVLDVLAPSGDGERPAFEAAAELAERARVAGIPNELTVTGTPPPDHAPVSLAVTRILRECLTNAGRHAPGEPVTLRVDWTAGAVCLRASNAAPAGADPAPGRGLTGIRHRAELLGGDCSVRLHAGRFEVSVRIPIRGSA
jgi:signal transduction histidine kinase